MYVLILLASLASYQPVTFDNEELCEKARQHMMASGIGPDRVFCVRTAR